MTKSGVGGGGTSCEGESVGVGSITMISPGSGGGGRVAVGCARGIAGVALVSTLFAEALGCSSELEALRFLEGMELVVVLELEVSDFLLLDAVEALVFCFLGIRALAAFWALVFFCLASSGGVGDSSSMSTFIMVFGGGDASRSNCSSSFGWEEVWISGEGESRVTLTSGPPAKEGPLSVPGWTTLSTSVAPAKERTGWTAAVTFVVWRG